MQCYIYTTLRVDEFDKIMDSCPQTTKGDYRGQTIFESGDSVRLMRMPLEESMNPFHKEFYSPSHGTLVDIQIFAGESTSENRRREELENEILRYLVPKIETPKIASCIDGSEINLESFLE